MDGITIGGVMVSVHASSAVVRMDRITIGGVMDSVHASSVVDRMDRISIFIVSYAFLFYYRLKQIKL
jgi:hypothetical protein